VVKLQTMLQQTKLPETVSTAQLGALFGVSAKTIAAWSKLGIAARVKYGRFDLARSVRAFAKHHKRSGSEPTVAATVGSARAQLLDIQTQRARFAMECEMGGWVREADVCADVTEAFRTVRDGMLRIPHRIAQDMPHLTRSDMTRIEDSTRAVLTELGAEGERIVKEIENAKQTALETGGSHGAPYPARSASGRTRRRSRG
jgi:phage terminase Nu1 subunit (DNA packaging protein)